MKQACVFAALSLGLASAASASTPPPLPTIAGIVAQSGPGNAQFDANNADFDILLTAVQTANLVDALNNPSSRLTVFAPSDAAFIRTARDLGFTGSDEAGAWNFLVSTLTTIGGGDPVPTLTNILLYHVAPQRLNSAQIFAREQRHQTIPTLLTGATLTPRSGTLVDADPDLINPRRVAPRDIRASNGIIQTIDRVLIPVNLPAGTAVPPDTIAGVVAASGGAFDSNTGDFDLLLTALQTAGLVDDLAATGARFTVFAPTDAAFIQTARDLGFTGTDEAGAWTFLVGAFTTLGSGDPVPPLRNVLLYHVLPVQFNARQLTFLSAFDLRLNTLLDGADLRLRRGGTEIVDLAPDIANPRRLTADRVPAINGSIFPINRVLLPLDP
ncbi:MAG: fasciclin domain-containing protein [Phycisphaerales bacterium]|nr:fasciclin domain-containing protein [Phycisphaerales bacterium]